ncbi:MAG: Asp-tRNA(Asn)/Glu-tRNA(Gln) amidotransferase subunit GatC [bacterium]|nr:Asp-tRNA(Asn)/Glu-tRNA(Gln) amidotransferase subunit GatC [bacterium]
MKIDKNMIQHLEVLSRIDLSPDEEVELADQLGRIVEYVEQLQEVETEGIPPTNSVVPDGRTQLRSDEPGPSLDRDVILAEAPDAEKGFFKVPKVVDRGTP